jgi:hypothetical protein
VREMMQVIVPASRTMAQGHRFDTGTFQEQLFSLWPDSLSKRHGRALVPGRLTRGSTGHPLAADGTPRGRGTKKMAGSGPAMTWRGKHDSAKMGIAGATARWRMSDSEGGSAMAAMAGDVG